MEYKLPKNEEEFVELFKKISREEFNWECDVPVIINSRLYSAYGKYFYEMKNKIPVVTRFEFNVNMINGKLKIDKVINTIKHELVHWYSNYTTKLNCGHNEIFIENCNKFGVTDFTDFERYKPRKRLKKDEFYEAKCLGCDRVVAKCKSISNLKRFMNRLAGTVCSCGYGKRYLMDKGIKRIYNHGEHSGYKEQWLDMDYFTNDLKIILCKEMNNI